MISWLHRLNGFKSSFKWHVTLNCSAVVDQRQIQRSHFRMEWLLLFLRVASPNSIKNQPNLFSIQTSKCLERRGNIKVLLYTLKQTFCVDIFMKMPKLVILGESTIWQTALFPHGKRTRTKSSRKLLRSVRIKREKVNPHIYK